MPIKAKKLHPIPREDNVNLSCQYLSIFGLFMCNCFAYTRYVVLNRSLSLLQRYKISIFSEISGIKQNKKINLFQYVPSSSRLNYFSRAVSNFEALAAGYFASRLFSFSSFNILPCKNQNIEIKNLFSIHEMI